MNNHVIIPIHSLVNLISNSSSETFVAVSDQTAKFFREMADSFLSLSGSNLKSTDIIDAQLGCRIEEPYTDEMAKIYKKAGGIHDKKNYEFIFGKKQLEKVLPLAKEYAAKESNQNVDDVDFEAFWEEKGEYYVNEEHFDVDDGSSRPFLLVAPKEGLDENMLGLAKNLCKSIDKFVSSIEARESNNY